MRVPVRPNPHLHFVSRLSITLAFVTALTVSPAIADKVDYLTQIKPLLAEKCYSCHGVLKQEADLRLETRQLMLQGDVVVPGDPDASELLTRITADAGERMPPPEDGAPLQPDQIELLRRWIDQGAKAPDETLPPAPNQHWAFQPITKPRPPAVPGQPDHPVDAILAAKRIAADVQPVGPADRSIIIRRLYLDLIGLPPTADQLRDERPWEQIVDDLLARSEHGERWARHWMDVWRYSDWYGLGKQLRYSQKHLWRWRDWIIRSLNDDKGYDRMILEMLAGDELAPTDPDAIAGTGYLARNYYLFNRTTWLDSTIEHTGKAFLGLTLNCAKCHDHKYDPISQLDYYRFRAIFEPHQVRLDPIPGVTDFEQDGLPRVFDDSVDRPTFVHLRGDPSNPDKDNPVSPGVPEILSDFADPVGPVPLPPSAFAPGTRSYVQQQAIRGAESAVAKAEQELVTAKMRLAESPSSEPTDRSAKATSFELTETFDGPADERWQLIGDGWQYRDGALHQTRSTREPQMARLTETLPRDFQVDCVYTTTGGSTYKSVTFRFDQSEDAKDANYVYTSAHAPGPKVQVAFTRGGNNTYPAQGRKALPIKVAQRYHLRFAVRETLVNVWLDDQFVVAYRFPDRREGFFSLSGFDATVAFDEITIKSLPPEVELTAAGNQAEPAVDPEHAVVAAEKKLAWATAALQSVRATIEADNVRYVRTESPEEVRKLAGIAARKQLRAKIADAQYRAVADAADEKKVKAANDQKSAAEKRLSELEKASPDQLPRYASLRGSKKALETPEHKEPDYPAVYPSTSTGRRLALAKWVASDQNPLTARVAVNQVWMRHFGTPLVESVFDFGLRAEKPLHADLLDFLAAEFIASGWSFKHLHRIIVTSDAYRLSSSTANSDEQTRTSDPTNRYYWRANSKRMESQLVRDSLLSLGGKLDPKMAGPSVDPGPAATRRSVYLKHSRDQQDKFLSMFDDADILQCYRRNESIVPQQALALSNSKLAIEMASEITSQITTGLEDDSPTNFINELFFQLLCREPTEAERSECRAFWDAMAELPELQTQDAAARDSAIRARLTQAIINHNDFVTIR
nr:PSD1 and planctomycete cytochrome C domain-containing protein [Rhodopirellula sp. JC639]